MTTNCTHHWMIEEPNGKTSTGVCRKCHVSKEFQNSYEYSSWRGTWRNYKDKKEGK